MDPFRLKVGLPQMSQGLIPGRIMHTLKRMGFFRDIPTPATPDNSNVRKTAMTANHPLGGQSGPAIRQMDPEPFLAALDAELALGRQTASELGLPFCTLSFAQSLDCSLAKHPIASWH